MLAAALSGDIREAARLARVNEFAGLLVEAYGSALNVPDLSGSGRREVRQILASHEQELVGLRVDLGPKGFGLGADVDREMSRIERAMEAAAGMGSPLVCLNVGMLPAAPMRETPRPVITQEQAGILILPDTVIAPPPPPPAIPITPADAAFMSQVDGALVELGRRADRYNAIVAMRTDLSGFAALERALRAAACPWFGVDLDPVAVLRDDWPMDEVFARLGESVRHVRRATRCAEANGERNRCPSGAEAWNGANCWPIWTRPATPVGSASIRWNLRIEWPRRWGGGSF